MTGIVKVKLNNGQELAFETEDDVDLERRAVAADRPADIDFQKTLSGVRTAAEEVFKTLKAMDVGPDGFEITLGVKVTTEMSAVIARASGEANFTVKMSWTGLRD